MVFGWQKKAGVDEMDIVGRVIATKSIKNTSREFYFWIGKGNEVNPLDLIVVDDEKRKFYGQVMDIENRTDMESPLDAITPYKFGTDIKEEDRTIERLEDRRLSMDIAKAQILGTSDKILMPPSFNKPVRLASGKEISEILTLDIKEEIKPERKIAIGYVQQAAVKEPIWIDLDWLTGPSAAHLNVSGKSRLAAKTSYALFLIQSILQKSKDVAVILFNVKGSELLQIHEGKLKISEIVKNDWKLMGLEPKPFDKEKTFYFLPTKKDSSTQISSETKNLSRDSKEINEQPNNYFCYKYTLKDIRGRLRYLLESARIPISDPQISFITQLDDNITTPPWYTNTFQELYDELEEKMKKIGDDGTYIGARSGTISVIRRNIYRIAKAQTSGVFGYDLQSVPHKKIKLPEIFVKDELTNGSIMVIDLNPLSDFEKTFLFGSILKSVEELMSAGRTDNSQPKKIILFVDELNMYVPRSGGREELSLLVDDVINITSRGGALGIILFGAEQFASKIHPQVYGNIANKAFGCTEPTETTESAYRDIPNDMKALMGGLRPGEMIVKYDYFGRHYKIGFPDRVIRKQEDI